MISKAALGEEHPQYAHTLNNLAALYSLMGDDARAEPLLHQALEIRKVTLGEKHPDYAYSVHNLAVVYYSLDDYVHAEPLYQQALRISAGHLDLSSDVQSERQQLAHQNQEQHFQDGYIAFMLNTNRSTAVGWDMLLGWKGRTFIRQQQLRQIANDRDANDVFHELQSDTRRLAALARAVPAQDQFDPWKQQLATLTDHRDNLEKLLSQRSAAYRNATHKITRFELFQALPEDSVLVDFHEFPQKNSQHLAVFIVDASGDLKGIDLGPIKPIVSAMDDWRNGFGTTTSSREATKLLREKIWLPIKAHLGKTATVLISADGAVSRLPFHALPGDKDGTYLIERYRMAYVPVPQLLPELLNRKANDSGPDGHLLLVGDIDYEAVPEGGDKSIKEKKPLTPDASTLLAGGTTRAGEGVTFTHLKGTADEIAFIKRLYSELLDASGDAIAELCGAAGTEEAFRQQAPRFRNLHVATHGFFAEPKYPSIQQASHNGEESAAQFSDAFSNPQMIRGFHPGVLSGLAFAGANRPLEPDKDDGILTAAEVGVLPLQGVDLVVLSACDTGLGPVAGGEGVLGLQRAFQLSGARTTITSLWEVHDTATRRLMERFYRNLWERKMGKLDALRDAQLWMLNHPEAAVPEASDPETTRKPGKIVARALDDKSARTSPEFWAAFVLSGDWR
jgi:CHAT domain-containing protein